MCHIPGYWKRLRAEEHARRGVNFVPAFAIFKFKV